MWSDVIPQDVQALGAELAKRAACEREAGRTIYPPQEQIFRALELTTPEKVKVCLVGQDPYHEAGQANGLCFSVNRGVLFPPSLKNIFKELVSDIGCPYPKSGDLTHWAEQGVLMLNTVLTVQDGTANSHRNWGCRISRRRYSRRVRSCRSRLCSSHGADRQEPFLPEFQFHNCLIRVWYFQVIQVPLGREKETM